MFNKRDRKIFKLIIPLLNVLSLIFKSISFINLKLRSFRREKFPEVFIISIGNLSFGGTGKTSMVISIGKLLKEAGVKFSVVTRGYGSKFEKEGAIVKEDNLCSEVGDEAKVLKKKFPDSDIIMGRNRRRSIRESIKRGNKIVILDDGFQSTHIKKDLSIMLVNGEHPYYYLRNFKFMIKKENYVLYYNPSFLKNSSRENSEYGFETTEFHDIDGGTFDPGRAGIYGFSALGDNRRFERDLSCFNLKSFKGFRDHHRFSRKDIEQLERARAEAGAEYLACTFKDLVKVIEDCPENIPLIYAENKIQFDLELRKYLESDVVKKKDSL